VTSRPHPSNLWSKKAAQSAWRSPSHRVMAVVTLAVTAAARASPPPSSRSAGRLHGRQKRCPPTLSSAIDEQQSQLQTPPVASASGAGRDRRSTPKPVFIEDRHQPERPAAFGSLVPDAYPRPATRSCSAGVPRQPGFGSRQVPGERHDEHVTASTRREHLRDAGAMFPLRPSRLQQVPALSRWLREGGTRGIDQAVAPGQPRPA